MKLLFPLVMVMAALSASAQQPFAAANDFNHWRENQEALAGLARPVAIGDLTPADTTGTNFICDLAVPVIMHSCTSHISILAITNQASADAPATYLRSSLLRIFGNGFTVSLPAAWQDDVGTLALYDQTAVGTRSFPGDTNNLTLMVRSWGGTNTSAYYLNRPPAHSPTVTKAFPPGAATNHSGVLDSGPSGYAYRPTITVQVITLATSHLNNSQKITFAVLASDDPNADASTFTPLSPAQTYTVTGSGGTGAAASTNSASLPAGAKRYLRLQQITDAGGDPSADGSSALTILF